MKKEDFFNELKKYKAYSKWVRNIKRIDIDSYNSIIQILSKDNNMTFESCLRYSFPFYSTHEGLSYWNMMIGYNKLDLYTKKELLVLNSCIKMWQNILLKNYQERYQFNK